MTASYFLRLICLSMAAFFLVHIALGFIVAITTRTALRLAERMAPRSAARFLLALRLFPAAAALFVVLALCAPSYLWLEPAAMAEYPGFVCLAAALLAAATWSISIGRAVRASARSIRYIRDCRRHGREMFLARHSASAWVIQGRLPFLALAGVAHPRLVASEGVMAALSADQFAVALRHELAHRDSRDNLKRLLILLAPDLLPRFHGFSALERAWARYAEWAADDCAVTGNSHRSVLLAEALIRLARLGIPPQPSPLIAPLVSDGQELADRVNRLLRPVTPGQDPGRTLTALLSILIVLAVALLTTAPLPTSFRIVHQLLEELMY